MHSENIKKKKTINYTLPVPNERVSTLHNFNDLQTHEACEGKGKKRTKLTEDERSQANKKKKKL